MDNKVYFASNLRFLRKKEHQSQTELGKLIGKSYNAIFNYEVGRNEPTLKEVMIFAEHFGVTVESLICDDLAFIDRGKR